MSNFILVEPSPEAKEQLHNIPQGCHLVSWAVDEEGVVQSWTYVEPDTLIVQTKVANRNREE